MRVFTFLALAVFLATFAAASSAQTYSDWSVTGTGWDKSYSVGIQLGLPLVSGVDISGHFSPRLVGSLGFGFIPGLISLGGQIRMNVLEPGPDKIVPFVGAGLNQYWLEEHERNADGVAFHVLVGGERLFGPDYGLGVFVGFTATLSKSTDPHVEVWGVNDDMSKLFLGLEGRYYF